MPTFHFRYPMSTRPTKSPNSSHTKICVSGLGKSGSDQEQPRPSFLRRLRTAVHQVDGSAQAAQARERPVPSDHGADLRTLQPCGVRESVKSHHSVRRACFPAAEVVGGPRRCGRAISRDDAELPRGRVCRDELRFPRRRIAPTEQLGRYVRCRSISHRAAPPRTAHPASRRDPTTATPLSRAIDRCHRLIPSTGRRSGTPC